MIELDLHVTRDGVLVVSHDPTVDRCTDGHGAISTLTMDEIRQFDAGHHHDPSGDGTFPFRGKGVRVPTFEEVLAELPEVRVNADLKPPDPELAPVVVAAIRRAGAVDRVCCGSKHDHIAERLLESFPEGCLFYPRQALSDFVRSAMRREEAPPSPGYRVLDMPYRIGNICLVNDAVLASARAQELFVAVWTVDDPAEMNELLDLGVGGIMTDRPDVLRRILDERGGLG